MLIWDQHESHKTPFIKDYVNSLGHSLLLIPVRSYLQPLDVSINKPFKSAMRDNCGEWYDNANEFTKNGNMNRASYGMVVDWYNFASRSISSKIIRKSFYACGLSQPRIVTELNARLKVILETIHQRFRLGRRR